MEIVNFVTVVAVLAYGLMFGIRNWILRIISIFTSSHYKQSEKGKWFDGIWIVLVVYSYFHQEMFVRFFG